MPYDEEVVRRTNDLKHAGSLDAKDQKVGTGMVGAPACGDVMKLQILVENGVIKKTRFKTMGCEAAISSSDYAAEWLEGKTLEEALTIKNTDILHALKLPPVKIHCSMLAEDAVKAAIKNYLEKQEAEDEASDSNAEGIFKVEIVDASDEANNTQEEDADNLSLANEAKVDEEEVA